MKSAFIIERKTYYRLLAPIIDEALKQGWKVECWHDYGQPQSGNKGYDFPSISSSPMFVHGKPTVKSYHGPQGLQELCMADGVDAVVSLNRAEPQPRAAPHAPMPKWIGVQHSIDFFLNHGPLGLLSYDVAALYSDWWLQWALAYFKQLGLTEGRDRFEQEIAAKSVSIGFPEIDQTRLIDPEEVRHRWEIPQDQPVVVLLPFPGAINPISFWARRIYGESNPLRQAWHALVQRRFEYWPQIVRRWNDLNVLKSIRSFCDRNDAFLLVKSRLKTPPPPYALALADKFLYDESHYPATILEALSIASLCISFYSSAVTEAISLGVPHLCITFSGEDYFDGDEKILNQALRRFKQFYHAQEGGLFQFQGASTAMSIAEAITTLPDKTLSDFQLDPQACREYVNKFLGYGDRQSSSRLLDTMERLCA